MKARDVDYIKSGRPSTKGGGCDWLQWEVGSDVVVLGTVNDRGLRSSCWR